MKTIEQMFDLKQKGIKEALKGKSKTEISIGLRWAINCATAFVPEEDKGTAKGFRFIEKWYQKFMELDRNYMIENMPVEPIEQIKLKAQDFAIAKEIAPESQFVADKAEEMATQEKMAEDNKEIEEALPIINPENL